MKQGRPSVFKSQYCREIELWMSEGYSILSFAGKIGVSEKTIYNWARYYEDFLQSIKVGKAKSALFWEKTGRRGMMGEIPHFNATVWIFQMKNRLGWSDKLTVDTELTEENSKKEDKNDKGENITQEVERLMKEYSGKLYGKKYVG